MAGEIKFPGGGAGLTMYARILGSGNSVWNTSGSTGGFEAFTSGNWTDYDISCVEQGVSQVYVGDFPAAVPAGVYDVEGRRQAGGAPAQTDAMVAAGTVHWNGSKAMPLSDLATSGQVGQGLPIRMARGVQVLNFPIYFKSAADHVTPLTSGVVSGQVARDGGNFGVLQSGAFTEVGLGWYNLQALTSGDMLANTAKLHFSAVGVSGGAADPVNIGLVLQRVSGQ